MSLFGREVSHSSNTKSCQFRKLLAAMSSQTSSCILQNTYFKPYYREILLCSLLVHIITVVSLLAGVKSAHFHAVFFQRPSVYEGTENGVDKS